MKKVIAIILLTVLMVGLFAGCGNQSLGFGNYTYKFVHVDTHNYSGCLTVKEWHDSETGIEVLTKEAGSIFLSEGTYVLISGDKGCPFCGSGTPKT